jgi:hypothetical protein
MSDTKYDEQQEAYMNEDILLLVDENDNIVGSATKKEGNM